ncbi:peptide ABC transporter substrate-binding protein [Paracoccus onubensis]|uniref:peptide ABC transporter substrate-binding protein n=1 Tax=Paracoccus onubensis TaxID=1675788 RepID=UPI0027301D62|nr:peptide ABC transporter substrate-binding protein [Paracoccus onubensis]MDP0927050.1 peptide ABC transporter substrate-binding protein [Paracoccus onubensis]
MKKIALLAGTAAILCGTMAHAERGSDGHLNILYWQAASNLNPYLSGIAKEVEAASLVLEPLARFDENGELVPWLAAEIPTLENGGLSEDLKRITWTLREGLLWSDGSPVTSKDVVFTWRYCSDPDSGCAAAAMFEGIETVEAVDDLTVRVDFSEPKPYPYTAFVSSEAPILQEAQFRDCVGSRIAQCSDQNMHPVGTGPYVVDEFLTNDVATFSVNPHFRFEDKPYFETVTIKGGGDAAGAARAVLQTGEMDYGWNLLLSPDVLESMGTGGPGEVVTVFGSSVEYLFLNQTNPDPALGAERSTAQAGAHPILADPRVGQALSLVIDRAAIAEVLFGETGKPTCNIVPAPEIYASTTNDACLTPDPDKARALLEEAGWVDDDGDGIREKDGIKLSLLFQSSVSAVRQDMQALLKQWWSEIGVETELKSVDASVFFGGDAGSPDTRQKFYADVQMYTDNSKGQDPETYLAHWVCDEAPRPETQWQGDNIQRFCSEEYDALAKKYHATAAPEDRAEVAREMNDMLVQSYTIIPIVHRGIVSGKARDLEGVRLNSWDSMIWNIMDWKRKKAE